MTLSLHSVLVILVEAAAAGGHALEEVVVVAVQVQGQGQGQQEITLQSTLLDYWVLDSNYLTALLF